VELIGAMPIEKAPVAILNMTSTFLETSKNSRLESAGAKTQSSSFIVKAIILVLASSSAAAFIAFYANLFQTNKNYTAPRESNKSLLKDIANTHLRYKDYDNGIKFLIGQLNFQKKLMRLTKLAICR